MNTVTLKLTKAEAWALRHAAGNVFVGLSGEEVRRDIFNGDGRDCAAGWRAWDKLTNRTAFSGSRQLAVNLYRAAD